jgi:hypothetical protein
MSNNHQFFKLDLQIFVTSELGAGLSNFCLWQWYICLYTRSDLWCGVGSKIKEPPNNLCNSIFMVTFLKRQLPLQKGKREGLSNCLKGDRKLEGNTLGTHWEHVGNTPKKISPSPPFCLDSCYALSLSVWNFYS